MTPFDMSRIDEAARKVLGNIRIMQMPPDAVINNRLQHNRALGRQVELDLSEPVEMIEIKGWRLQFIPSEGDFAGQPMSRVFVTIRGELGEAKRVCRARYGAAAHILAGACLHEDARFGDWNG